MAGGAASVTSKRRRLSQMPLDEYVKYVENNKESLTLSDRSIKLEYLDAMVISLSSDDKEEQLETISLFRNILSDPDPPFQQIMQVKAYSQFVDFLDLHSSPNLLFEALSIIGLFLHSSIHSRDLELQRVGQSLINLIGGPFTSQALDTIAIFASRSPEDSHILVDSGFIEKVAGMYKSDYMHNLDHIMPCMLGALKTMCSEPLHADLSVQVFKLVFEILRKSNDNHIKETGSWILFNILPKDNNATLPYRDMSIPFFLNVIQLLGDISSTVILPNILTIEKISMHSLRMAKVMAQPDPLSHLLLLVVHKDSVPIKIAACKVIGHIARQSETRTQAVVAAGLVPALHHVFRASKESTLRKEAAKALVTLLYSSTTADCRGICGYCIEPLTCLLGHPVFDLICLDTMDKVLRIFTEDSDVTHGLALHLRIFEDLGYVEHLKKLITGSGELKTIALGILERHFSHVPIC